MTSLRTTATVCLALVLSAAATGELWIRSSYAAQDRAAIDASPSARFPLGTDALGRDRLARLVYGTRVSLLLAPAAAIFSCAAAALLGIAAGWMGGMVEIAIMSCADLFLSVPWILLLLIVRAWLPLNVSPAASLAITFALLGVLGWGAPARILRAAAARLKASDFILMAQAQGISPARLLWRHIVPNMMPILLAQFWIAVPVYILAETTLGMLGLGIAEPLPSWGGLLREIEGADPFSRLWLLAPALLLTIVMASLQILRPRQDSPA
ncbi:MAG: ABC transporter permease subunit [Acidobacteriia bacterium]|nr:ABC transporter permease subunit [Terriglobia bacterium]